MKNRILLIALVFGTAVWANDDAKHPRLNEGQLFTVTLTPGNKTVEVDVAGKTVAVIKPGDVEISAIARISGRDYPLPSSGKGPHFVLLLPPDLPVRDKYEVELKVHGPSSVERMNFKNVSIPRP